jgi:hypothetical protein
MRRIESQTRREVERQQELALFEQRRTQEIQAQMEQEQVRGAELDQAQSINVEMETERARGLELDENRARFQQVERRQMAERRQRQDILDFREEQPLGLANLLSNVIRTGAQTAGLDLVGQELALPENLGGVTPPTVNLPPRQRDPGFLEKALGVAGTAGRVVDFITDPSQVIGRARESLQRPSVTGQPTLEQQRRQALFATTTERLAPPSLAELQEEGATVSRPVVDVATDVAAAPFRGVESAGIPGVSPAAGGVANVIQSQIVEDIGTELINPVNIALAAPFALQGTAGLTGGRLAAQIASNLTATGLEPALVRGTLRGLTAIGARGAAAARALPKAVRETPIIQQALKGIRETPEAGGRLGDVPPLRGGEPVNPHIAKADPGPPPPPKEPPPAKPQPTPDDPKFASIQEVAIKNEPVEETLLRRHQGAIDTFKRDAQIEVTDGNQLLREAEMGQGFRGTIVPRAGQTDEFDELYRFLHNPSKVDSGDLTVPDKLRPMYDKLRAQTNWEQAARLDFDPEQGLVEDYFFRGWKPPEGAFIGEARGQLGRKPGFKLPRVDATYDEMRAAGFEPLFWNPFEQQRYSRLMGVKYREQMLLIEDIKVLELALPHDGGPIPQGWRVPKVGAAFEGKPFAIVDNAGDARSLFTRRWIVPESLANRLENAYGVTPDFGTVSAFGITADLRKVTDALVFIPKRAKLIASVFQHVDFLTRSGVGSVAAFTNALRHGQPVEAVAHLLKWPKSAGTILRATVSPGYRQNLRRLAVDSTDLFTDRPGLSMRSISEAGLSLQDVTIFPDLDSIAREAARGSKVKAVVSQIADLERLNRQGLFQGVYPAAILTDVKNNIAPMIVHNYPNETAAQLSGRIAKIANIKYSTIPGSQSVVQNRFMRNLLTRFFFSMGEQEGLLRAFTGAVKGENAAFWREHWVGAYLGLMGVANVIHFASTGEPLPISRYAPLSANKWGPLPFGYNRDFAAPNIPLTGRSGTEVTMDLVGQLDTAFRLLDPASFLTSRVSVPLRTGLNQLKEEDFFGAPIDNVGPAGVISRTSQLIFDTFAPIGFGQAALQLARDNISGAEKVIQPGEARLGTQGTLAQATGINLRAETTPQLLRRIRGEVMRELKIKEAYDKLPKTTKADVDDEVEKRIGEELALRGETAELRGQVTPQTEFFNETKASRARQEQEQLEADAQFTSNAWTAGVWRSDFTDRNRAFFNQREGMKQFAEIEFEDHPAENKIDAAIDAYFDVNVDDYKLGDGTTDWSGFFDAQDAALAPLSPSEKRDVLAKVIHKFDTPTVVEFRRAQSLLDDAPERFVGISRDEEREASDFRELVDQSRDRLSVRGLDPGDSTIEQYLAVAQDNGVAPSMAYRAFALRPNSEGADKLRNVRYTEFLADNARLLVTFFPELYGSRRMLPLVPPDLQERVITSVR